MSPKRWARGKRLGSGFVSPRKKSKWPYPVYRAKVVLRAPRDFVFRWCALYRSDDGKWCGGPFVRKVLERASETFVLQDR